MPSTTDSPSLANPPSPSTTPFDIHTTYLRLLTEDPDLTMPVAAIEALILALSTRPSNTISETLSHVSHLTHQLKTSVANPISLSAGTDLFQQYLISNLQRRGGSSVYDFDSMRAHLVQNGRLFVDRAKAARETIAGFGRSFIREGATVMAMGGSRVVGALLKSAAEAGNGSKSGRGSIRFRVIHVVTSADDKESAANIAALRERDIPVATIPPTAIAYCMDLVTQCFVGAEGVVENGGVVSRLGTFQMATLAKAAGKPFYVVSESHKFVRLYPLGQRDLGIEQGIVRFKTAKGEEEKGEEGFVRGDEGVADMGQEDGRVGKRVAGLRCPPEEAVDYTPPQFISGIITESGVLLPSAVSEELIKIWF